MKIKFEYICKQSRDLANIDLELSTDCVMSSFHELQEVCILSYEDGPVHDNRFSVSHEEFMPKNEKHIRFSLKEMKMPNFRSDVI